MAIGKATSGHTRSITLRHVWLAVLGAAFALRQRTAKATADGLAGSQFRRGAATGAFSGPVVVRHDRWPRNS